MVKIKTGSLVSIIRGSIGSTTYSRNRAGDFARTRVIPNNPKTARQGEVRSNFVYVQRQWATLSQQDQDTWINAAKGRQFPQRKKKVGDFQEISGFNLFCMFNFNRRNIGLPILGDYTGDGLTDPAIPVSVTWYSSISSLVLVLDVAPIYNSYLVIFSTGNLPKALSNYDGKYKEIVAVTLSVGSQYYNLTYDFEEKFGTFDPSKPVGFFYKQISTLGLSGLSGATPFVLG